MVALRAPLHEHEPIQPESLTRRRLRKQETVKFGRLMQALAFKRESTMLPLWEHLMAFRAEQPRPHHGGRCPTCQCAPRHRTCARCQWCRDAVMRSRR
jgi:hypothetical protein